MPSPASWLRHFSAAPPSTRSASPTPALMSLNVLTTPPDTGAGNARLPKAWNANGRDPSSLPLITLTWAATNAAQRALQYLQRQRMQMQSMCLMVLRCVAGLTPTRQQRDPGATSRAELPLRAGTAPLSGSGEIPPDRLTQATRGFPEAGKLGWRRGSVIEPAASWGDVSEQSMRRD